MSRYSSEMLSGPFLYHQLFSQAQSDNRLFEGNSWGIHPVALIHGWAMTESGKNPYAIRYEPAFYNKYIVPLGLRNETEARARATSWGLFQIMGQVAREHDFRAKYLAELCDPNINIQYAVEHLLYRTAQGDGEIAGGLARYNGGKYGNMEAPYRRQEYVDKVVANAREIQRRLNL